MRIALVAVIHGVTMSEVVHLATITKHTRERDREKRKNITDEDINHPNTKTSKRQAELETGVIKIVFIIPQASYRHLLNKKKVSFYFTFFVFSTFVGVFNYQF